MRFAVAKHDGLDETQVDNIDDGWDASALSERQKAALGFADAYLAAEGPMSSAAATAFDSQFDPAQQTEIAVGLALFHGFSKVLIALGCEPSEMDTIELPTPGAA